MIDGGWSLRREEAMEPVRGRVWLQDREEEEKPVWMQKNGG